MGSSDAIEEGVDYQLVLFDGVCNLCNGAVRFIIDRDRKRKFRFASLQSRTGEEMLKKYKGTSAGLYSILLIKNGRAYDQSSAVLEISRELSGLWPALYGFMIVPAFIRNWVYSLVAANRYRLFGRKDECMIPTPDLKARFLP